MSPITAGFDDDEFVSAASFTEFGSVGAGRDADGFFVDEGAALRLGGGEGCGKKKCEGKGREENGGFPKWETEVRCRYPPSPRSIGIMELGENREKILELQ